MRTSSKNIFVLFSAFISIVLLIVARHHPPSRRKIKEIWHGRVYWESNTTMLRSAPEKVLGSVEPSTAIPSESTNEYLADITSRLERPSQDCQDIVKHHRCSKPYSFNADGLKLDFKANVLILGDSLPWQMWMTLKCMLPPTSHISFDFTGMHLFPETESIFMDMLNEHTKHKHYDYLVFTIGTLYNWNWENDIDTSAQVDWTMNTLKTHCPSGLRDELFTQKDVYQRALLSRSKCKKLLSMNAYVSGLKKLKKIAELGTFPPIIWKDVPPQHWNTPTGQYDWGGTPGACSDISDAEHAYSRNRIADVILNDSVSFARTWETDITSWKNHVGNDCTHYCNPSDNTINWGVEVLKTIAAQKPSEISGPKVSVPVENTTPNVIAPLHTKPMIAICAATHSKSTWRSLGDTTLQNMLIPSIEKTISTSDRSKYDFRLYLAADHDDHFWLQNQNNVKTPDWLSVHIGFYDVPEHKIPFNPMMRAAYNDGAEYMVRINDDSEFITSDWVSKAVAKLASYDPPNVGMVGPNCRDGNTKIMTHDMVHRTHLDIFEHYYPDVFSAWWIDDWISKVYGPQRSTKMMDWTVKHHVHKHGTRYEVQHHEAQLLKGELEKGAAKIEAWLSPSPNNFRGVAPDSTIPIVLTGINYQMNQVSRATIPFMCSNNERVIILSNIKQNPISGADCLEVEDISDLYYKASSEMPWPKRAPGNQKVFFDRWYVLRDWMRQSGTQRVFAMDSDAFLIQNITKLVKDNWNVFRQHEVWFAYNPPHSSWPYVLLTIAALEDITHFWNQALAPDVWTSEFVRRTEPNDMVLLGHYSHSAVGKPYPCWGYGPEHKDGTCDNSIAYGHTKVLERLAAKNIRAKFSPGTLTLDRNGKSVVGIFDPNYRSDPIQRYEMKNGQKQLQFLKGVPQFKLKTGKWMSMWGYILEDSAEACINVHLELVKSKATCVCSDFCCKTCLRVTVGPSASIKVKETAKTCWETYQVNIDSKISVAFIPGKSVMMESTSVKLLCDFMSADKDVLEWGSGGSTNFFSQFVKHWDTIEHDAVWASKIKQQALKGVDYHSVPTNWKASTPRDGNYDEFKEYVEFPKTLNKQWDVILIDGRSRVACAESVLRNHLLKKDGIVVVHDWERDHANKDPDSNYKKMLKYYDVVTEDISGPRHLGILKPKKQVPSVEKSPNNFKIHVLTMNRAKSLQRLLASLENSEYDDFTVDLYIHIDKSNDNQGCIRVAESFDFSHGDVTIEVAEQNSGLRDSWFNAWYPKAEERAIIFEDDMEVSPLWFKWLNKAWDAYSDRKNLAGISLQIQTLKAKNPHHNNWNPGSKGAFLYRIPGSWGFSPHPIQWKSFLDWIRAQDLNTLDVSTPGLITSDWWQKLDHRGMWTQYYIYFCVQHDLFTLYANLPERKTLTAHWREKGVHTPTSSGIDFPLASKVTFEFPSKPRKYDWDGEAIEEPVSRTTKPTLVVTGMTRNDYKHQDATIKTIKRQMNNFDVIKVIIYENDSTDNTLNGLNTWSELLNIPVQIITQTNLKGSRTERFATGRNALIKAVRTPEPDYMLLIDMDGVSDDLEGVETCLDLPEKWGVCCTNQRDVYYDLWVLRTFDNWCDCDVWYDSKCAADRNAKFKYIPPSSPPIRVKSCFGGAALYNYKRKVKELIDRGAHYEADPVGHVFFHKSLRELDNDLELYIQPKMLNTAPGEHIPAPVKKREMKKKENFNTVPQTSSECPNGFQYHKSPQNLTYKASLRALPPWNWDMLQKKYDKKCQTQTSVKSQSDSIHLLSPLTDVVEKIKAASPTCKGGKCNNFLAIEVGTMFGTGTTKHLYQAISKTYNEFQLWTYEGMTERFCIAQNNLKELKHIYIVNELVMRNNILTCMVMPETGTVLSKPGGPSYSELLKKTEHEIQKGVIGGWFETYPVGRTADLVVIDSVRFTHVGIIEALNSANGLISSDTVFVMENDYWENTDELAILRKYFDLENVETLNTPGERWPWVTFKLQ
jgi:glycosyltransferase involved in cell wall biosynthesis